MGEPGRERSLTEMFEASAGRAAAFTKALESEKGSVWVDYSKTHVAGEDVEAWACMMEKLEMKKKIEGLFSGEKINYTEGRAVLHTKLRSRKVLDAARSGAGAGLDEVEGAIVAELAKMRRMCEDFSSGALKGMTGRPIKNVVNIGIGGSDLGPRLLTSAMRPWRKEGKFRYVSNVDAQEIHERLSGLSVEETLFVVVSKTFTTQETLENARIALSWAKGEYEKSGAQVDERSMVRAHFMAVSAAKGKAVEFGIDEANVLDMWDFVGGRYSLWSCVSLSSAMAMGFDAFLELLEGGLAMDEHFRKEPPASNLPMFHALVENRYINLCGFNNKCVVPYDHFLELLPAYLQQCEMESNGKASRKTGDLLIGDKREFIAEGIKDPGKQTGAIIWGGVGTNVQHSYFQLLHQGTVRVLAEFLIALEPSYAHPRRNTEAGDPEDSTTSHDVLFSNCLAQSRALMEGKEGEDNDRWFSGNRPSITVLYSKLCPFTLGMLVALYEHKIFVQGVVWEINSFDQFGVELGKVLAKEILCIIEKHHPQAGAEGPGEKCARGESPLDQSTTALLQRYLERKMHPHPHPARPRGKE